jgi:hypothetical protein
MWVIMYIIFKKPTTQNKQSPNGRQFAQSGHPDYIINTNPSFLTAASGSIKSLLKMHFWRCKKAIISG